LPLTVEDALDSMWKRFHAEASKTGLPKTAASSATQAQLEDLYCGGGVPQPSLRKRGLAYLKLKDHLKLKLAVIQTQCFFVE